MANSTSGQSSNGRESNGLRGVQSQVAEEGGRIMNAMSDKASEMADKAREIPERASARADAAIGTVGEKMHSVAGTLRNNAPKEGRVACAVEKVADTLDSGGDYLSDKGVTDIAHDVTGVVKRYPMQSLWIGLGLGFLVGKLASNRR